jgi:hypothetical protein
MVAIMVAHFDSAVERNRDFRHSVQDLDSSLSRLGAQTAFAFPPYTWRFLAPVFSMQFSL